MLRCTKCILPETYPNIEFNENGVCNYCLSHKPVKYKGEHALSEILNAHRNKGKKYDCIVGVSGGRDSSFLLYSLVKKYGMRVLAYNFENGFTSEDAKRNLRNMINRLNVDFVQIKSQLQGKLLKRHILGWARNPKSEVFPQLCYGCAMGSHGGAYRIARKMEIPLLITGRSQAELASFRKLLIYSKFPLRRLTHDYNLTPLNLFLKAVRNPLYLDPRNLRHYVQLGIEFPAKGWRVGGEETFKGLESDENVKVVRFFDFIEHNQEDTSVIEKELGWQKSQKLSSSWRFDCKIHALKTYIDIRKVGFSENVELLSKLIRDKVVSRDVALRRVEQQKQDINALLAIAEQVFEQINLPKKYRDRFIYC